MYSIKSGTGPALQELLEMVCIYDYTYKKKRECMIVHLCTTFVCLSSLNVLFWMTSVQGIHVNPDIS